MKERPILFSAPMVRAILPGNKTKTRRIVQWGRVHMDGISPDMCNENGYKALSDDRKSIRVAPWTKHALELLVCPYGQPGDRLWVRETWKYCGWSEDGIPQIEYKADGYERFISDYPDEWIGRIEDEWAKLSTPDNYNIDRSASDRKWRPSIHMPRWASRITLEIVSVRVERLQDIDDRESGKEGIRYYPYKGPYCDSGKLIFKQLWESINGDGSWDANPWVWVIEFRRIG